MLKKIIAWDLLNKPQDYRACHGLIVITKNREKYLKYGILRQNEKTNMHSGDRFLITTFFH